MAHHKSLTIDISSLPDITRLDHLVAETLAMSRSSARGLFDTDGVKLDGRFVKDPGQTKGSGKKLDLSYIPGKKYQPYGHGWHDRPFHIVHEDRTLLVVEKQAGILSVPSDKKERNTLLDAIADYLKHYDPERPTPIAVHRLDRETSGLLVFAKNRTVADALIEQFKQQKPSRTYAVLVKGVMKEVTGTFESRFITDAYLNQQSSRTGEKGLLAITDFKVVERLTDTTYVHAKLRTGRRNQIRVHFSEAGHPVLGDQRYKTEEAKHPLWPHKRLALHALSLGFTHPLSHKLLSFESAIPLEMETFITSAKK